MTAAERLRHLPIAGARLRLAPVVLPSLILLSVVARVALWLADHPLHHDEALYGSWARLIASGRDPLLLTSWVDKPPFAIYLQAASLYLLRPSVMALRLPGMLASVLAVPVLFALARQAYGRTTAAAAAALLALSAFAIQFSPTAFTDPWLVLFALVACWAALARRSFLAGLAAGFAVASKQQGLLVIPLVVALLTVAHSRCERRPGALRFAAYELLPALFGFMLVFVPTTYWDSLRWAKRPSFWDRSLATYGGLQLAAVASWPGRVAAWVESLRYLFGPAAGTLVVAAFATVAGLSSFRRRGYEEAVDRILTLYVLAFLAIHVAIGFQPWDRYLLPLAPFVALLGARGVMLVLTSAARANASVSGWALAALLAVTVGWGGVAAALGRFPVGSDHGAYAGVSTLAARLEELPTGDALYYHSLGWHYDFYLFDAPLERRWWGSAWKLADDAAKTAASEPRRGQWIVLPPADAGAAADLRLALQTRNLSLADTRWLGTVGGQPTWLYRIGVSGQP